MKKYLAELLGTYSLVFCGTGAIVIHELFGNPDHVGIAFTFGLIVMAMIYAFGDISGAHINPAVTISFFVAGRFAGKEIIPYIVAQLAGALFASLSLHYLFPQSSGLGMTLPAGSPMQSFILEIILSFILMQVILLVSQGSREKGILAGAAIGAIVLLEAMFAGPVSGASMNPARSIAPAIVSGQLQSIWIYMAAPVIGMILASLVHRLLFTEKRTPIGLTKR